MTLRTTPLERCCVFGSTTLMQSCTKEPWNPRLPQRDGCGAVPAGIPYFVLTWVKRRDARCLLLVARAKEMGAEARRRKSPSRQSDALLRPRTSFPSGAPKGRFTRSRGAAEKKELTRRREDPKRKPMKYPALPEIGRRATRANPCSPWPPLRRPPSDRASARSMIHSLADGPNKSGHRLLATGWPA